jgi:hypothetical protein
MLSIFFKLTVKFEMTVGLILTAFGEDFVKISFSYVIPERSLLFNIFEFLQNNWDKKLNLIQVGALLELNMRTSILSCPIWLALLSLRIKYIWVTRCHDLRRSSLLPLETCHL